MFRISIVLALCLGCLATEAQSPSIDVPHGARLLLTAEGDGVQIYNCTIGHWELKAPDAKLLDANGKQIGTHFAGPTWKLNDGSEVKGKAVASHPSPDGKGVPWLLLQAVPDSGKGKFADVAYIRRTNTHGGVSPGDPCNGPAISIPYHADYSFYAAK